MAILIETPRLLMKEMVEEDTLNLFHLNSDPEVIRYTGDKPFNNKTEAREFILRYQSIYQKYRCGRLSTFIKETGEYIGWCGLKYLADKDEIDLGYRFIKQYWGKGYATESAAACLKDGFKRLKLDKINAIAAKDNTASINVFKKLSLNYIEDEPCDDELCVRYTITKKEWNKSKDFLKSASKI